MLHFNCSRSGTALAAIWLVAGAVSVGSPASAADVTYDRLVNADKEPQNWLTNHQNYNSQRFSRLDQINRTNAKDLKLAYAVTLKYNQGNAARPWGDNQATPLVEDGFMYVVDGWSRVSKIDVRNGKRGLIVWKYDPAVDKEFLTGGIRSRGVALLGDQVYVLARDGRILSLKASTGEPTWEQKLNYTVGHYFTVAPLAIKDKIVYGAAGGETGSRDWIEAADAKTGKALWRFNTVAGPGERGAETWADDHNAYETGGGSIWVTGSFDPATNQTIWGVGNPSPDYDPEYRPGDNLYTNSAVALDADSGQYRWHFQYTPNDAWDYDEVGSHVLIDTVVNGEPRKILTHVARNGFVYNLDRTNGSFIGAKTYTQVNWTKGLDAKTGKPLEYNPALKLQPYANKPGRTTGRVEVCPHIQGGTNFFPTAYNPNTGMIYAGSIEGCSTIDNLALVAGKIPPRGGAWSGGAANPKGKIVGSIVAIDVATGDTKAKMNLPQVQYSGMLATAGGVVFSGQLDGEFLALDATNLTPLWNMNLGISFVAPPMSFAVNGKQYIAILGGSGPTGAAFLAQGDNADVAKNMEQGSVLYVFSL